MECSEPSTTQLPEIYSLQHVRMFRAHAEERQHAQKFTFLTFYSDKIKAGAHQLALKENPANPN